MAVAELEDLDGNIDVVVFPRVYEKTRSLWTEDNVLLVKGEVDLRNERLQLICNEAKKLESDWSTAESGPVSRQFLSYEQDLALRPAPQEELPYEEFGVEEDDEDIVSAPVTEIAPQETSPPEMPESEPVSVSPPVPPQTVAPRRTIPRYGLRGNGLHILITLPRTDELEEDLQRMLQLNEILKTHRGNDRISLLVRDGPVVTRLEPMERIAYSEEFHHQVENLLGEGSVQVREER